MRATVPGITVGVAYLSITGGDADDELVAVSCEAAARVEIHETRGEAGVTTMRAVARLPIASHRTVRLAPAGLHLMLVDLRHALSAGSTVPLTLEFARAGRLVVRARVAEPGAMTAPSHD